MRFASVKSNVLFPVYAGSIRDACVIFQRSRPVCLLLQGMSPRVLPQFGQETMVCEVSLLYAHDDEIDLPTRQ